MNLVKRVRDLRKAVEATDAIEAAAVRDYCPYGAARDLMRSGETEILIEGPAGTGKTRAVLEKVFEYVHCNPGSRALLVRKTRQSLSETVLVTWEEKVIPAGHPALGGPSRKFRTTYEFPGGGTVAVGGMEGGSKGEDARIMSSEYDMIAAFEATDLTENDWEKLITRLRNRQLPIQQAIADCNPGAPSHWLNKRANAGYMQRLLSRHTDNPVLFTQDEPQEMTEAGDDYLNHKLGRLSGVRRERLLNGRWAASEGMVYEEFDAAVHVVDEAPKIGDNWKRIRVIDFGYTNPFVCQWWAIDPDGRMYLYRELYGAGRIVADWAKLIAKHSQGEHIEATIADHDAEDRATLKTCGIQTVAAHKSILPGIQAVEERLRDPGDGRPRLYFCRSALVERDEELSGAGKPVSTLEEIDGYVWPKGVDGKANKEHPVKDDDHGMDAMRYAVAFVDGIGRQRPQAVVVNVPKRRQSRAKSRGMQWQ